MKPTQNPPTKQKANVVKTFFASIGVFSAVGAWIGFELGLLLALCMIAAFTGWAFGG